MKKYRLINDVQSPLMILKKGIVRTKPEWKMLLKSFDLTFFEDFFKANFEQTTKKNETTDKGRPVIAPAYGCPSNFKPKAPKP